MLYQLKRHLQATLPGECRLSMLSNYYVAMYPYTKMYRDVGMIQIE